MCGFSGFFDLAETADEAVGFLHQMIAGIAHRGPEEMGYYFDETIGIGTARLAIIDRPGGQQPMSADEDRYWLGFNGEIFNFIELRAELVALGREFRTRSDTEVLVNALAEWGTDALPMLNGQFGFVFYDRVDRKMLLGRDRFGERPVFYSRIDDGLAFSSEIKGLFNLPLVAREISVAGVAETARFWSPNPTATCFGGVNSLPPGHYAVFAEGELDVVQYAGFPSPAAATVDRLADATETLRGAVERSVELRLRGDFEVGAFLSGGVDSAIVANVAREQLPYEMKTFSVAFDDPAIDESSQAREVAEWMGTDHSEVRVSRADVRDSFPTVVRQAESVLHRTAPVASRILAQHVHESNIRVVLGGEGADEVFLGYDIMKEAAFLDGFARFDGDEARLAWLDQLFFDYFKTSSVKSQEIVDFYKRADFSGLPFGAHVRRFLAEPFSALALDCDETSLDADFLAAVREFDVEFDSRSFLGRAQVLDFVTILSGYGLPCQCDRVGAGSQMEARYPFLDPAVVGAAFTFSEDLKLRDGRADKYVLRQAYRDALPPSVAARPKQGMRAPGAESLLRGKADDWVAAMTSPENLAKSTVAGAGAAEVVALAHSREDGKVAFPHTHSYIQLLSLLLLEHFYIANFEPLDPDIESLIIRRIDGRNLKPLVSY
ncbi:MAG: asparagine synthase (glutamine-hydrolyzing) [Solirubrobacterales bacterium]